jgi:hypothetical protein
MALLAKIDQASMTNVLLLRTYGGIWTNTTAARLLPGGPQAESIISVSCAIQSATVSSTQSGTGWEFGPAVFPAVAKYGQHSVDKDEVEISGYIGNRMPTGSRRVQSL